VLNGGGQFGHHNEEDEQCDKTRKQQRKRRFEQVPARALETRRDVAISRATHFESFKSGYAPGIGEPER
jgi:hypothetical protein